MTKKKLWKSAIYHSIKHPFDAQVDKRFLNVTYCKCKQLFWTVHNSFFHKFYLMAHLEKSALRVGAKVLNPAIWIPIEAGFENPHRA